MSFSDRLATIRKKRKMTQQQMADAIGIHVSQIKRYESSDTQPSLEVLRKIALALNVSADLLLFDQQERGPDDELRLQFEAVSHLAPKEKAIIKELLEGMIIKYQARRWDTAR
ncbi:MAG: helix-turn-helix transcriptional regulator [Candidatus Thiodiazotropha sp.]|jgi:transcriptional regulator with XRE-family HTH domain